MVTCVAPPTPLIPIRPVSNAVPLAHVSSNINPPGLVHCLCGNYRQFVLKINDQRPHQLRGKRALNVHRAGGHEGPRGAVVSELATSVILDRKTVSLRSDGFAQSTCHVYRFRPKCVGRFEKLASSTKTKVLITMFIGYGRVFFFFSLLKAASGAPRRNDTSIESFTRARKHIFELILKEPRLSS